MTQLLSIIILVAEMGVICKQMYYDRLDTS